MNGMFQVGVATLMAVGVLVVLVPPPRSLLQRRLRRNRGEAAVGPARRLLVRSGLGTLAMLGVLAIAMLRGWDSWTLAGPVVAMLVVLAGGLIGEWSTGPADDMRRAPLIPRALPDLLSRPTMWGLAGLAVVVPAGAVAGGLVYRAKTRPIHCFPAIDAGALRPLDLTLFAVVLSYSLLASLAGVLAIRSALRRRSHTSAGDEIDLALRRWSARRAAGGTIAAQLVLLGQLIPAVALANLRITCGTDEPHTVIGAVPSGIGMAVVAVGVLVWLATVLPWPALPQDRPPAPEPQHTGPQTTPAQ